MKKLSSLLLTLVVLMSMTLTAFAASVSQTTSATTVEPGKEITVTLTLNDDVTDIISFEYYFSWDESMFEYVSHANGNVHSNMWINPLASNLYTVNVIENGNEFNLSAGTVATFTFKAKENVSGTASFKLESQGIYDATGTDLTSAVSPDLSVEIKAPTPTPTPTPTPDTPTPTPDTPTPTPDTPTPTPDTPTPTPNVPSSTPAPTPDIPDTADNSTMMLWGAMMIASLAGAIVITKKKLSSN